MKHRQTELRMRIEQHGQARDEYRLTLESLISLASRAAEIFEGSKTEQCASSDHLRQMRA